MSAPIEFGDGDTKISIESFIDGKLSALTINTKFWSQTLLVNKELYHLLEQAMPHIRAIVESEE